MRAANRSAVISGEALARLPSSMNLSEQVLGVLTEAIVEGRLVPGSLYSVQALASRLGVSRTPVREALIQLARRGMVRFERNQGVRIMETSVHDLEEIFEIRLWLEVPATEQAALRAGTREIRRIRREFQAMLRSARLEDESGFWRHDRAFHLSILQSSGNLRLAHYVDSLRDLILMRGATTTWHSRTLREIVEEHSPILEALDAGSGRRAAEMMRQHIRHTAELVLAQERRGSAMGP